MISSYIYVLAIDPGTKVNGVVLAVIDGHGEIVNIPFKGVLPTGRVAEILRQRTVAGYPIDDVVCERVGFYGKNSGDSLFETCIAIGRFREAWGQPIVRIYRQTIKALICQTTKAGDAQINQAVADRLGKPGTRALPGLTYGIKYHAKSALAVALAYTFLLLTGEVEQLRDDEDIDPECKDYWEI